MEENNKKDQFINEHPVISDLYLKPGLQSTPASQHKRFLNLLIDTYIIGFCILFLWYFLILMFNIILSIQHLLLIIIISYILYYLVFEFLIGNTPAKYLTNTKVTTSDNKQPSFLTILLRTFCRFIPLDLISYISSGYPRGFHDRLSHTIVTDTADHKLSPVHPFLGFLILIIDFIGFCAIFIMTFIVFRYFMINLKPELRTLKNIPAIITDEINTLTQQKTAILNFNDTTYGISFRYNESWSKIGDLDNVSQPAILFVRSKKAFFRINKPETAYSSKDLNISYAKEFLNISSLAKISEESKTTINNRKFFKFITNEISDGKNVTILRLITFKDNIAYIFTYIGYEEEFEKYLPEAQNIINSIQIK